MGIDVNETKGLKIGDRIESSYLKGYFKVYDIKRGYRDGKDTGNILLLKKAFTGAMKFSFSAEKQRIREDNVTAHKNSDTHFSA